MHNVVMRLGAPVTPASVAPESWIAVLRSKGYRASYCPVTLDSEASLRREYRQAAGEADIVIAEVGAWSNPLSPDADEAQRAFEKCVASLRLADEVGAVCCVNIAGNMGQGPWDGPAPENLVPEAFDRIVASVQRIIDEAAPERACYCLETMPWMLPDSAESYLDFIQAIDRPRFGVHFDPVNLLNSPRRHFGNGEFIKACVDALGDRILSVHAKDQATNAHLTLLLDEAIPGSGVVDYQVLLSCLNGLGPDLPLMIEHLSSEEEYDQAAAFIRTQAAAVGATL
jgi:sugar phosphate isomerase/epimerase